MNYTVSKTKTNFFRTCNSSQEEKAVATGFIQGVKICFVKSEGYEATFEDADGINVKVYIDYSKGCWGATEASTGLRIPIKEIAKNKDILFNNLSRLGIGKLLQQNYYRNLASKLEKIKEFEHNEK